MHPRVLTASPHGPHVSMHVPASWLSCDKAQLQVTKEVLFTQKPLLLSAIAFQMQLLTLV